MKKDTLIVGGILTVVGIYALVKRAGIDTENLIETAPLTLGALATPSSLGRLALPPALDRSVTLPLASQEAIIQEIGPAKASVLGIIPRIGGYTPPPIELLPEAVEAFTGMQGQYRVTEGVFNIGPFGPDPMLFRGLETGTKYWYRRIPVGGTLAWWVHKASGAWEQI